MGTGSQAAGIAAYLVQCGFEVWLWDMEQEQVRNGLNRVRSVLKADIRSGRITKNEFEILITQRLRLTTSLSDFGDVDLVFDAFRADLETRRAVYAALEDGCRRDTLIASAHPVRESDLLAGMLQHPQRLLGIRFVNPLKRMQLVEISAGPNSAEGVVGTAVHFARHIGKTPVVVNDIPGFFVNRILLSIISEFCYLVGQGINPYHIDGQITDFGLAVGPAQMCDFNSIVQISGHIEYLRHRLGERWEVPPICQYLSEVAVENHGSPTGWYVYQGEVPAPNLKYLDTLKGYLSQNGLSHKRIGGDEILSRILARAVNEAAFAFQDDVSNAIPELDLSVVYGVGFPPYRGGIFRYADTWGISRVVRILETLSKEAPRFAPAPLLEEMAQTGKTFYDV
jgi:3-hydroxyacyl-CoA dehydrogenase